MSKYSSHTKGNRTPKEREGEKERNWAAEGSGSPSTVGWTVPVFPLTATTERNSNQPTPSLRLSLCKDTSYDPTGSYARVFTRVNPYVFRERSRSWLTRPLSITPLVSLICKSTYCYKRIEKDRFHRAMFVELKRNVFIAQPLIFVSTFLAVNRVL